MAGSLLIRWEVGQKKETSEVSSIKPAFSVTLTANAACLKSTFLA